MQGSTGIDIREVKYLKNRERCLRKNLLKENEVALLSMDADVVQHSVPHENQHPVNELDDEVLQTRRRTAQILLPLRYNKTHKVTISLELRITFRQNVFPSK